MKEDDIMLVNSIEMLQKAKVNKYAVPQFNINNLEWTRYILEECNAKGRDVILGVSEGAIKYMGGYNVVVGIVTNLIKDLNITINVCLHLDHGQSYESCVKAIDAGFTSVMIDASKYEIEKNIEITRRVVEYAHARGISVEAEVGHIGGTEDEVSGGSLNATLEDCLQLINNTGIDSIAPALGSVHGLYKGEPNLDYVTMKEIDDNVSIPLVLHGGTGIGDEDIKKAISCGIAKININTELQIAWSNAVRDFIINDNATYDPRKVIGSGQAALREAVDKKLDLFYGIR